MESSSIRPAPRKARETSGLCVRFGMPSGECNECQAVDATFSELTNRSEED